MLNPETLSILLIGTGEKLHAREKKLQEAGIKKLSVITYNNDEPISFFGYDIAMIVGLSDEESGSLYNSAKAAHCLVNVEDKKQYCDFFFQSFVKRGKLLISVSTQGATPGTTKIIRDKIEEIFPPEWEKYIDEIAELRQKWKVEGKSYDEINSLTQSHMQKHIT